MSGVVARIGVAVATSVVAGTMVAGKSFVGRGV